MYNFLNVRIKTYLGLNKRIIGFYLSNRSNGFKKYPKNTDKPTIKAIMKELTKGT